jgi:hypothetical protein
MRTAIFALGAVACLMATPSFSPPAQAQDVRIGVDRDYDRPGWREPGWRHRHEGCREVTIRERRGGEMVVRHIRRCD